jgi:hypothetical protein
VSGIGRAIEDADIRAQVVAAAGYTPADRYILFERALLEVYCNG